MDTKRLSMAMAVGLVLILGYYWLLPHLEKKLGMEPPPAGPITATTAPSTTQPTTAPSTEPFVATTQPTTGPATAPSLTAGSASHVVPAQGGPGQTLRIGSEAENDGLFALQLEVQPAGAGVQSVILNEFKKTAQGKDPYIFEEASAQRLDTAALASRTVTVDGVAYDLLGVQWSVLHQEPTWVEYGATLVDSRGGEDHPLLAIRKRYTIKTRNDLDHSLGYEVKVELGFDNLSDRPLRVKTDFNGTTLPPPETTRSPDRQITGGFKDGNSIDVISHPIEEFKPDKDGGIVDLTKDSKGRPARWAGGVSNYFAAVVLPETRTGAAAADPDYIGRIIAHGVNIDTTTPMEEHHAYLTFETSEIKLAAKEQATLPMSVFFGPKWRKVLDSPHYATMPRMYNLLVKVGGGACGFLTWSWLVNGMIGLLSALKYVLHDWGLAIIGLVAIVRILLHPITKRSQISMAKMSKMGPEMERLKKKYANDKDALNKAMVDFHKEQGLGPYLGCLPMFLQMPIWIALYSVLQSTFELRHAPFLWGYTWIHDLSAPDYLVKFSHPVPLVFGWELHGINLLPVLLAVVMFIQQQFTPKPVAATPEQQQQQKMMQWLSPAMFLIFFYGLPSGLNLYIFTSTAIGIIESKVVRDHLRQREEAEKAGRVFVETKPTRGSKRKTEPAEATPKRGLAAKWAQLLEKADELRKEQEKRGKK